MLHRVVKARIYPSQQQVIKLAQFFGCARWYWNNSLGLTTRLYKETGKGLGQIEMNSRLLQLKKEYEWLGDCHSQVLQSVSLNLSREFVNFFEKRATYPRFKAKHGKQSIQYPQGVKFKGSRSIYIPKIGWAKIKLHRPIEGRVKTVTIVKHPSGEYYAAILSEVEGDNPKPMTEGKAIGVDLGLIDFAVTSDGSKYANPKHLSLHQKNLKRKQQKLSRKQAGSNRRAKALLQVAKVHQQIANTRKDFLHKLSHKLVNENQVIAVESLNVKGMVKNHNLALAISDCGWSTFVGMLRYKCEREGKVLIEIDRFFPSSKTCNYCYHQVGEIPLDVRSWVCPNCYTRHDRDVNAAKNILEEGFRLLALGTSATAKGGEVSPKRGRKSSVRRSPMSLEALSEG